MKKLLNKLGIYDSKSFKAFIVQFIKFGIVGIVNTVLFFVIYYPLIYFGVHYILANIIAFIIGTLNSFYWNYKYVFKPAGGSKSRQLFKLFITYGFTVTLGSILLFILVDIIGISEYIAPIISFIFTVPTNFLLIKFWVFRTPKE